MAGGVPVSTLSIELVAEIARLQTDLAKARRAVSDATGAMNSSLMTLEKTAGVVRTALGAVGAAIASIGVANVVSGIIQTNKEFQSLSAQLKTSTGSIALAAAEMARLKQFATETPYGLDQAVKGFVKLKNLGLDPSIEALRSYGNTASAMGKSLNDMIEAVADASTGEFERLKEFGIRASQAGDKVTFTFQGVSTTVKKSASEIEGYLRKIGETNFATAMSDQMNTLEGQAANLADALDQAMVAFGEGGFNAAISGLVQSMTGAADASQSTAAQLGYLAGEAVRAATAFMETLGPAIGWVIDNIDTLSALLAAGAAAWVAYHAAVKAAAIASAVSQLIALERALGAANAVTAAGGVAAKGLQAGFLAASVGARALVASLGPIAIALTAAAVAYQLMADRTADATQASGAYAAATATSTKLEQEAANVALQLAGATGTAREQLRLSAIQKRAAAVEAGVLAVRNYEAAKSEIALAQAAAQRAQIRSTINPLSGGLLNWLTGDSAAAGGLQEARNNLAAASDTVLRLDKSIQGLDKALASANKPLAAVSTGLGKTAVAAREAKKPIDELMESYKELTRSVQQTLNALEQQISYQPPEMASANNWVSEQAKALDDVIAKIDAVPGALEASNDRIEKNLETTRALSDELRDLSRAFDQIGGSLGRTMGDIFALLEGLNSGDFSGMRGPVGAIFQILGKNDGGKELLKGFEGILDKVFGSTGTFTKMVGGALEGAGIGMAASSIILGKNGSKLGSAIGGAIGSAIGSALGSALGPIGSILGGLLGGAIGDMIAGQKRGAAIITGTSITGTYGNNAQRKDASTDLASQVISIVDKIASTLGAKIDAAAGSVSIGIRDSNYRVDTAGRGYTKLDGNPEVINFGTDAAAAITAAAMDLIKDGVITGLRAGTEALLKSTKGTLDEQLAKAQAFEAVFKELAAMKDPAGTAMAQLQAEFDQLKGIFTEAGASAAEYAQLEELFQLKKAELEKQDQAASQSNRERRELEIRIMELEGKTAEALAAARALELDELDASLRPLQERIYALQDEAEAAAKAAEIAKASRSLDIQLMEALGNSAGALAARRADELAAMDESLRSKQQEIWAAQDAADAAKELAAANEAAAAAAQQLAEKRRTLEIQILELEGNSIAALAAKRADELAALDPSLRAMQERVYALEDLRAAEEAAAQAAQLAADEAAKRNELEIALMRALGNETGAVAAERARELAALPETLRALQAQLYLEQDLAATRQAETDRLAKRFELENELLRAQGKEVEAVARERARELEALDPSLRALQELVWAAQDAAVAVGGAADALDLLKQQTDLTIRLLEAQGNATAALAMRREQELAATHETLRPLLLQIYAAEDAAAAAQALADAEAKAADAARAAKQAQEEAARAAAELAKQRTSLEIELMRALGNETGALAAQRQMELAGLDESLRALQQQVWAAQDAAAAQEALAQAQQEAAEKAEQLRKDRVGLEARLLELQGYTAAATALRRQEELAAMDASLRPLQMMIYALEDAQAAEEARTNAINSARDALSAAYERESGALKDTIERFADFGKELREFRSTLTTGGDSPFDAYRRAQAAFVDTAALARTGDATALGKLSSVSQAFLDASRNQAGSLIEYQRDVSRVMRATDAAISASDDAVDYAQEQLNALNAIAASVDILPQAVLTFAEALAAFQAAEAAQAPQPVQLVQPAAQAPVTIAVPELQQANADLKAEIVALRADMQASGLAIATNTRKAADVLEKADRGGSLAIVTDSDSPIAAEITA